MSCALLTWKGISVTTIALPAGPAVLFHQRPGPHLDDAAAGAIGLADPLAAEDEAGRGKVRALDQPACRSSKSRVGIVDDRDQGVDHLAEVVGRDLGRHADRDPFGTVDQQVGKLAGQNQRLLQRVVVVGAEVDGLLVDVGQQLPGEAGHAHLGVTHRRRRVAVDGAEVPLAVDQRVAHGEVLGHAHDGVVDGGVAVGMVLTDDVADHAGRLLVGLVPLVAEFAHGEEHPAVDRLEAVAHVGQGAADDDAHGVVHVGLAHLVFDVDGNFVLLRNPFISSRDRPWRVPQQNNDRTAARVPGCVRYPGWIR